MPLTKAQSRAQTKYNKESRSIFSLCFHNKNDADVIAKLKSVDNKTDYIRQLILKDIRTEK